MVPVKDRKSYRIEEPVTKDQFKQYFDKCCNDMGALDPYVVDVRSFWNQIEDGDTITFIKYGNEGMFGSLYLLDKKEKGTVRLSISCGMF